MTLKAVLFDFNGTIVNDEPLHEQFIAEILVEENLRLNAGEFREVCLGRSDRACFSELLVRRGRFVTEAYLDELLDRKSQRYQEHLQTLEMLPIYPDLTDLILQLRTANLVLGVVSGATRSEIELILDRAQLAAQFEVIVSGDEVKNSKPDPEGYLLAVDRLRQRYPEANLQASECLAIEDSYAGIAAAKNAQMQVVGVAHTYPFHMLQRMCDWTIDRLSELEVDRVLSRSML